MLIKLKQYDHPRQAAQDRSPGAHSGGIEDYLQAAAVDIALIQTYNHSV
jgi:hypothetical protein